jgi:hypothetical protein
MREVSINPVERRVASRDGAADGWILDILDRSKEDKLKDFAAKCGQDTTD